MTITLRGKMKSGKNRIRIHPVTGVHYPTPEFKVWRRNMEAQIFGHTGIVRYSIPISAKILYWPGDLIRRDAPGILDALWHVLERVKIVADDSLIQAIEYRQMPLDRADPRILLHLSPMAERNL